MRFNIISFFIISIIICLCITSVDAVSLSNFTSNATSGATPLAIQFINTSSGFSGSPGYAWFFGDETYNQPWTLVNSSSGMGIGYGVVLKNNTIVYIEQLNQTVWRSVNSGLTWAYVNTSSDTSQIIYTYTLNALSNGVLIATGANSTDGIWMGEFMVWRSTDLGKSWNLINDTNGIYPRIDSKSVTLLNDDVLIFGGGEPFPFPPHFTYTDVWRSGDGGYTWSDIATLPSEFNKDNGIAVLPNGVIMLTGGSGYHSGGFGDGASIEDYSSSTRCSFDNGESWFIQNASGGWVDRIGLNSIGMPDNSVVLFGGSNIIGGYYNDVWRTTDNGSTWSNINISAGWLPRYKSSSVILNDSKVMLIGGTNGSVLHDVWIFNPVGSSVANPVHVYSNSGYYSVALQTFNASTYNSTFKSNYIASSTIGVIFSATPVSGTAPLTVTFIDGTIGSPTVWNWSFGDGTYSDNQSPVHIFTNAGTYNVILNASNGYTSGNYSRTISVGAAYPVAQFTSSTTYGSSPLTVYYTDTSTTYGITTWSWDFGDGGTSTLQNPSYIYTTNGVYHVTLTVTDSVGVDTSDETIIYVSSSPLPLVNFVGTPLSSGSAPLTVYFTDLSQNINIPTTIWNWSFGDGSYAASQNPTHIYTSGGQYSVTLLVTNSSVTNYSTKYGYINVGVPVGNVFVDYTATPVSGVNPLIVQFNDASVCNPICNNWNWDLDGDGSIDSYTKNPSYTYTYPGIYSPRLIVSNGLDSGVKIKVHYITAGTVYVPTTIPQPIESWRPGYNGTVFNIQGGSTIDMPNSTYLKYWLQNFTTTGNFSIYGFALGMMAPIMHVFGFWIFLIVWGLYLFAVWIRSQDVTLPLIIGILTMGTFGLLFPKETLPVIIIMFVICGAIIITKLMKE